MSQAGLQAALVPTSSGSGSPSLCLAGPTPLFRARLMWPSCSREEGQRASLFFLLLHLCCSSFKMEVTVDSFGFPLSLPKGKCLGIGAWGNFLLVKWPLAVPPC